jgi:hypothetical protein
VATATSNASSGTCAGVFLGGAVANSTITWKATHAKVNPTTISGDVLTPLVDGHGIGFQEQNGSVTGSFMGASDSTNAYLDSLTGPTVLAGLTGPTVTSANAATNSVLPGGNPCEPRLKIKIPKHPPFTAQLKAGKGIKKISVGPSGAGVTGLAPANGDGTASTFALGFEG